MPLAMGVGLATAVQTSLNAQLRTHVGSALNAALISFMIGTVVLAVMVFLQQQDRPSITNLQHIPWYLCLGICQLRGSSFQ